MNKYVWEALLRRGEGVFLEREIRGFLMRRGRKRDRRVFGVLACRWMEWHFNVTMWNIRIWDTEVRSRQTSRTGDGRLSCACVLQASEYCVACNAILGSYVLAYRHFLTTIVLPLHHHQPPHTPYPHPLAISFETVLREEVGASLIWQPSNGPRHPFHVFSRSLSHKIKSHL